MNKKFYDYAEIEIVRFEIEDVIVASSVKGPDDTDSDDTEILR